MKQKAYRTKRLELRDFRATDWSVWLQAQLARPDQGGKWDQPRLQKHRLTQSSFKRQLDAQKTRFNENGVFIWTLFDRATGAFVGWIDISTICRGEYQIANLGWYIEHSHRRKGYAREAVTKLISVAFSDLDFHRLEASIVPQNRASIAVARSCGLTREGLKKLYLRVNGVWKDHVVFITTPELYYER